MNTIGLECLECRSLDAIALHIVCRALDKLGVITYTWCLVGNHCDLWEQCETTCRQWVDAIVREYRRSGW